MGRNGSTDDGHEPEGLRADLPHLTRRRVVTAGLAFEGAGLAWWAAGGGAQALTGTGPDGATCVSMLPEMAGPFPADGTNASAGRRVNVLAEAGVIREDIRTSIGGLTPVAGGVPMQMDIRLVDVRRACAPLAGMAVYAWQCDAEGVYSIYEAADRNYLRGVGISDAQGRVRLTTVVPGCYPGRWPHIHFQVFASADRAATGDDAILTGQFALPEAPCRAAYDTDPLYRASIAALRNIPFARDRIFRNGTDSERAAQMMRMEGSPARGYVATAQVGLVL